MNIFEKIRLHQTDDNFIPLPASEPTTADPGTEKKIDVLTNRIELGEELWHTDDPIIDYSDSESEFFAKPTILPHRREHAKKPKNLK